MTYEEVYKLFYEKTNISPSLVSDYRPCCEMFGVSNIANAIVVWLESGEKIIFIAEQNE